MVGSFIFIAIGTIGIKYIVKSEDGLLKWLRIYDIMQPKEGKTMILYHGSNVEVRAPKLLKIQRELDFGKGF